MTGPMLRERLRDAGLSAWELATYSASTRTGPLHGETARAPVPGGQPDNARAQYPREHRPPPRRPGVPLAARLSDETRRATRPRACRRAGNRIAAHAADVSRPIRGDGGAHAGLVFATFTQTLRLSIVQLYVADSAATASALAARDPP